MQPFRLCQLISIVLSLALHVDWVTIVSVYSDPTFSPKRRRAPSEAMRKRPAAATDTKEQSEEGNREARPADQQQADERIQATEGKGSEFELALSRAERLVKDMRVCRGPCGGIVLHKSHQTRSSHPMRVLTPQEARDWVQKKVQETVEGPARRAAHVGTSVTWPPMRAPCTT